MSKKNKRRQGNEVDYWDGDRGGLEVQGSDDIRNGGGNDNERENTEDRNGDHPSTDFPPELNLGEYTQAAESTVHSMRVAHHAIKNLAEQYMRHITEIEEIARIRRTCATLAEQNKHKDKKIKDQKITIRTLQDERHEQEEGLVAEEQRLSDERIRLEKEIDKLAKDKETATKRHIMQEAELKNKLDKELQKLKSEQEQKFNDRKNALEVEQQKQKQTMEMRLAELESTNSILRENLKEYQKQVQDQRKELAKAKENLDDQERVKKMLKAETRSLEAELKTLQNEFGLNTGTTEY
jgi:chromosome segregation ATPase